MSKKFTLNELLIITCAKEIKDFQNVILGVGLPTTAGALAKAFYAPHATLMMESGIVDFQPLVPLNHIADAHCCRGFSYATDLFSAFTMTYRGFVDICFLGVGQIDRFGNINTTCIGDYHNPKSRLPGSGGASPIGALARRTLIISLHDTKRLADKVDFITTPGYIDGPGARERWGLPPDTGPACIVTNKAVLRFDKTTGEAFLASIHPGSTLEEIRANTPWDLQIADDVHETEPPTADELRAIREVLDPHRMIKIYEGRGYI